MLVYTYQTTRQYWHKQLPHTHKQSNPSNLTQAISPKQSHSSNNKSNRQKHTLIINQHQRHHPKTHKEELKDLAHTKRLVIITIRETNSQEYPRHQTYQNAHLFALYINIDYYLDKIAIPKSTGYLFSYLSSIYNNIWCLVASMYFCLK